MAKRNLHGSHNAESTAVFSFFRYCTCETRTSYERQIWMNGPYPAQCSSTRSRRSLVQLVHVQIAQLIPRTSTPTTELRLLRLDASRADSAARNTLQCNGSMQENTIIVVAWHKRNFPSWLFFSQHNCIAGLNADIRTLIFFMHENSKSTLMLTQSTV